MDNILNALSALVWTIAGVVGAIGIIAALRVACGDSLKDIWGQSDG